MRKFIAVLVISLVATGCVTTEPGKVGSNRVGDVFTLQREAVTYACTDSFSGKDKKAICITPSDDVIARNNKVMEHIPSGTQIRIAGFKKYTGMTLTFHLTYVQVLGSDRQFLAASLEDLQGIGR